jgi:hypothetical protein
VLTLWDFDKQEPFVAAAAHRFGTRHSLPLDNFHQGFGGVSPPIDLRTGRLGAALTLDAAHQVQRLPRHPESGSTIEGVAVPHWAQTQRELCALAARLPQTPIVG